MEQIVLIYFVMVVVGLNTKRMHNKKDRIILQMMNTLKDDCSDKLRSNGPGTFLLMCR